MSAPAGSIRAFASAWPARVVCALSLALCAAFAAASAQAAEAPPAPATSAATADPAAEAALALAGQLHAAGRHDACAVEALRSWWLAPAADPGPAVSLASRCLIAADDLPAALRVLRHPRLTETVSKTPELVVRRCHLSAWVEPQVRLATECTAGTGAPRWAEVAQHLLRDRWLQAEQLAATLTVDDSTRPWASATAAWTREARELPGPSPLLAASLSAVVPGSGRVYIGKWQDGLASLALVGVPGYFAATGFERDGVSSVRGWLLGTTAGVLYLGNVYGSWIGAEAVAKQSHRGLQQRIRDGVRQWIAP